MNNKYNVVLGWFAAPGLEFFVGKNQQAMVRPGFRHTVYHGVFEALSEEKFKGFMEDEFGKADLVDGRFLTDTIQFTKKYRHRADLIRYDLTRSKDTGLYVGTYNGEATGEGHTRFLLTPAPVEFFA